MDELPLVGGAVGGIEHRNRTEVVLSSIRGFLVRFDGGEELVEAEEDGFWLVRPGVRVGPSLHLLWPGRAHEERGALVIEREQALFSLDQRLGPGDRRGEA